MSQVTTSPVKSNQDATGQSVKVYDQSEKNKIIEKLVAARIALLLKHPFFGNLASRMNLIDASDWCPTLATDGRNFYYNIEFVDKLKPKGVEFGFAHEILHNVFDHLGRKGDRNFELFNIAADYAVNQILVDERIGERPTNIKIFQNNKYRGWSFEKIYEDLEKNYDADSLSSVGQLFDLHIDNSGKQGQPVLSDEEIRQIKDEIKEAMIAAAQSAGSLPAGIKRLISDITEPKLNWKQLLRMNIQSIIRSNYSFSRPNRKSQHCGAILPGTIQDETIDVCVSFDMSGSISNKMAAEMLSEVKGIMEEYTDFTLHLWTFDTKVYGYKKFTADNQDEITDYVPKGGGGTRFECNWDFMKLNDIEPKKFIMFTDGYPGYGWGDPDYADTIFIVHGSNKIVAPFGQTFYYDKE